MIFWYFVKQCFFVGFVGVGVMVCEFFQNGLILFDVIVINFVVVKCQIGDLVVIEYFGFVGFGQNQEFMGIIVFNWVGIGMYWNSLKFYLFIGVQIVD